MNGLAGGIFTTFLAITPVVEDDNFVQVAQEAAMVCEAEILQNKIGQRLDNFLEADLMAEARAKAIRIGRPGTAFTMDYREDRLNVIVDAKGVITQIYCG